MAYQGCFLKAMIPDKTRDVFCHGQVVMLFVMRRLAMVPQILSSLVDSLYDGSKCRRTKAYTYLPKSRANALEVVSINSYQNLRHGSPLLAHSSIILL